MIKDINFLFQFKGVKLFEGNTAVSASVDQRLKLWKIDWEEQVYIFS